MAHAEDARSTKTVIYETIKTRLMDIKLKPGDTLSDSKLARELKVSRKPVREALEVAVLRLAATKDIDKDLEAIAHLLDEHATIIGDFSGQSKFLEDAEFHRALIRMGRNAYLMNIVESIFECIQMIRSIKGLSQRRV